MARVCQQILIIVIYSGDQKYAGKEILEVSMHIMQSNIIGISNKGEKLIGHYECSPFIGSLDVFLETTKGVNEFVRGYKCTFKT